MDIENIEATDTMDSAEDSERDAISEFVEENELVYKYFVSADQDRKRWISWRIAKTPNGRYAVKEEDFDELRCFLLPKKHGVRVRIEEVGEAWIEPDKQPIKELEVDTLGLGDLLPN